MMDLDSRLEFYMRLVKKHGVISAERMRKK